MLCSVVPFHLHIQLIFKFFSQFTVNQFKSSSNFAQFLFEQDLSHLVNKNNEIRKVILNVIETELNHNPPILCVHLMYTI